MNELNLYQLFKDIISKSKVMRRFVTAPDYGNELNKNNLGEQFDEVFLSITDDYKYPLCIMFPPVEFPNFDYNWSKYNCKIFFLTTPFDSNSGTLETNSFTGLSNHTIEETWKDMTVCAKDFKKFLSGIIEFNTNLGIREPESPIVIQRFSNLGNDKAAGVSLVFDVELAMSCEMEDYKESDISTFKINITDIHPHHEH